MIRIVKMHFMPEATHQFEELFSEVYPKINAFEGCNGVKLLRDKQHPEIYFTYSHWQSAQHLEEYRHSAFFKTTWKRTKALFAEPASAWSVEEIKQ